MLKSLAVKPNVGIVSMFGDLPNVTCYSNESPNPVQNFGIVPVDQQGITQDYGKFSPIRLLGVPRHEYVGPYRLNLARNQTRRGTLAWRIVSDQHFQPQWVNSRAVTGDFALDNPAEKKTPA